MRSGLIALMCAALLGGIGSPPVAVAVSPDGCEGAFATRGLCVVVVTAPAGPVRVSVSGVAYGVGEARIDVRLENAANGEILARCSANSTETGPTEVRCGRQVELPSPGSFVGLCIAEGRLAGRFACDAFA